MGRDPKKIDSDHLLFCEGKSTLLVLGPLLRHHGIQGFQPFDFGGTGDFGDFLKDVVMLPGFAARVRTVAIVRDVELGAEATLASARESIRRANLAVPENAGDIAAGEPRVGLFLVPDNASPGMIETLCMWSVADDPAVGCVENFFAKVKELAGREPRNKHKAQTQAYLATQEEAHYHIGTAANEGVWNFDHASFAPLVQFLRTLASWNDC